MTTFTRTWDSSYEASPPDSQAASQGATRIREVKLDIRERLAVDHSMDGDANDGAHNKATLLEQSADPTAAANTGFVYTKDVDGTTELFYQDSSGNVAQISSKGGIGYVGEVKSFAFSTPPTGWLECDGSAVSRTTYAELFSAIGTTFGSGDGSTTFNLPDLRGEFLRGWDNGRGVDASRAFGSSQSDQNKSHTHTATIDSAGAHTHTISENDLNSQGGSGRAMSNSSTETGTQTTSSNGSHTHTITIDNDGGTEARPRNVALLFCIKY